MSGAQLKQPTAEQNHSYGECLRFDRMKFADRMTGRSGFLTAEQRAEHEAHYRTVCTALDDGVGFNRTAFPA